ncbi:hypothetical protein GCM10027275_37930 [Rhabdobacter roseus]
MGNYAGTQALYHNPAFVADSRYSVFVNLAATQLYEASNYAKYDAPYSLLSIVTNTVPAEYRSERGGILFPRTYVGEKLTGGIKHLNLGGDTRLPSLMVSLLDGKVGVAVTSRARYMLNIAQVTEPIAQLARGGAREPAIQNQLFENQAGNLHLNGLGEVAFTLGGVVVDRETEFFKAGLTVKRVLGLYNAHAVLENTSYEIRPDPAWNNMRQLVRSPQITADYGYTADGAFENFQLSPAWLLGNAPAGSGWGFDLGMVYEYRPEIRKYSHNERGGRKYDHSKNKYLYRIALSVTGIGRVHFKNPNYVTNYSVNATNRNFTYDIFQRLNGSSGFYNAIDQSMGVSAADRQTSFRSVLPMAFQASVDYQLQPNIYLSTLWVQSLRSAGAFGMRAESVLAVTPRYEHKWYELSVPLSLMNRYRSPSIGLAGRAGPLWLGTDHLFGLLNIGKPQAFNLYVGISAGLYRRPPQSATRCWPRENSWLRRLFQRKN